MLKRYGSYLADWRDAHGKRLRKAFPTKKAALRFQRKQQQLVHAKKGPASSARVKRSKHGQKHVAPTPLTAASAKSSRSKSATFRRAKSRHSSPRRSSKSGSAVSTGGQRRATGNP